ncbi:Spo0B domain-containing protein, partial [Enterococcus faecium]|uniref:Spo0B domain-containing protein n=1 Tax=Enterococcus faecium TaxID=1352 RepID=UPI0030C800CB
QYIHSMRAQTHEFMNKLHVISGLIDLKKYEEVTHFIQQLNQNRDKFSQSVQEVASVDLAKMGLIIVSFTIKEVRDKNGYLDS